MTEPMGENGSVSDETPIIQDRFLFDCDQLIILCSAIEKLNVLEQTESLLQVRVEDLEQRWRKVQTSYETVMLSPASDVPKTLKDKASVNYNVCLETYYVAKSRLVDLMKVGASPNPRNEASRLAISPNDLPSPRQSLSDQYTDYSGICIKVPPCDTEVFEGGYEEWPSFRDMFTAVYGNHPKLTKAQKLYHLRNKTKGPAGAIVKRYPLCDENFDLAWNALRSRYENKRVLVDNQLKILFNIPNATVETSETIQRIQSTVNDCLATLKTLSVNVDHWDPILIYLISTKLPDKTLSLWEESLKTHNELPMWSQLDAFLINRFEIVERLSSIRSTKDKYSGGMQKAQTYSSQERLNSSCPLGNSDHSIRICPKFRRFSEQERIDFAFKNKLCNNCLSPNHSKQKCTSKNTCIICHKMHHSLLHLNRSDGKNQSSDPVENRSSHPGNKPERQALDNIPSSSNQNSQVHSNFASNDEVILLRTALVQIDIRGELFTARALIDPGSQRTFVTEKLMKLLRIPSKIAQFEIYGIGGKNQTANKECEICLYSYRYDLRFSVNAIVLPKVTQHLPAMSFTIPNSHRLEDIDLADPNFNKSAQIDLVLGNDSERFINMEGVRKNVCGNTSAYNTVFGWVLSGPMKSEQIHSFTTNVAPNDAPSLEKVLRKFWEIEEIPCSRPLSEDERYCEELYASTTTRHEDGRYIVRLPFNKDFPESVYLGSSRFFALGQLKRIEQTLMKNPDLQTQYNAVLEEYLSLGHMEETSNVEISSNGKCNSFYLPHHAVVRPEHKSTKVRIVFNASRKSKSGFSLNDVLLTGPTLQTELISTVLNWRKYKYVFCGDIQKMYRQILVHPDDRCFQRIVYQRDANSPVKDYQLKTVTFGLNCAPYLAIRSLLQLASDCERQFPKVASVLRKETYVDDILAGGYSIAETKQIQSQLMITLSSAGFPLKKITANDSQLLEHLSPEDLYDTDFLRLDEASSTKTLGIKWNALTDSFTYVMNPVQSPSSLTKRHILSMVAQLFDPAGWITPIVIRAKILMQQLWLEGCGWDDIISEDSRRSWEQLYFDFSHISSIRIPRWIQYMPSDKIQIHGFSDASKAAYCACVYIRVQASGYVAYSNLLVAKSKVAPLQTVCLPRLELNGAELLAKLVNYIVNLFDLKNSDMILWTDSSIVLGWLSKPPWSWETYVANRTSKIHTLVPRAQWRHVSTHDNPSDLGTRGCRPQELQNNLLWWNGPSWLTNPPATWPKSNPIPTPETGRRVQAFNVSSETSDILDRFSSYTKALRVVSYIFRFYNRLRHNVDVVTHSSIDLTHSEIVFSKKRLISIIQKQYFKREYDAILRKSPLPKDSPLNPINPFIDQDDILRVNGRLAHSALPYNESHPIILPGNSRLCTLFLSHLHNFLVHADCILMCRMVQTEFYISRLKPRVKSIIRRCKVCTIFKQKSCSQIMAPLPLDRCTITPPFHVTGLDFAGPFELRTSHLRKAPVVKGYVSVFVCFSTKAIHLEPCSDLSSPAFEATFARFVGRRGLPRRVVSDNGRNFVGASRVLLREFSKFIKSATKDISDKYGAHGFEWNFIPPHAPHMGGLWEAAVKSFKHHFKRVAGSHKFTYEQLATVLARIEGVLNSRPISAISEDPSDLTALTPGHFLKGAPMLSLPEPLTQNISVVNRWTKLKALHHQFAIQWKDDYLKSLQKRYKWKQPNRNVQIGDLVVLIDDLMPPNEWRLGRIEQTHCGPDAPSVGLICIGAWYAKASTAFVCAPDSQKLRRWKEVAL
ncbi:uncharacterized protein LOC142235455 [Haematobia irritans]|uniref:uncharacterized protein LOC142235455 n=1 Tax=Haematobia irritans TaxID=7368 RepID=UPI003F4F511A